MNELHPMYKVLTKNAQCVAPSKCPRTLITQEPNIELASPSVHRESYIDYCAKEQTSKTKQTNKQTKKKKNNNLKEQNSSLVAKPWISQTVRARELRIASKERCEQDYGSVHVNLCCPISWRPNRDHSFFT